jgi:hypothetical protein
MMLNELAPELLHLIAYTGLLSHKDVLSLVQTCGAVAEKLVGDAYGRDKLRSLLGVVDCAESGWLRAVRFAMQTKPSVNDMHDSLACAASNGHSDIVAFLLAWRGPAGEWIDATANRNAAVSWAILDGRTETTKLLLDWQGPNGERVDPTTERRIETAARDGFTDTVMLLFDDPRIDYQARFRAFLQAVTQGQVSTVCRMLAWRGPNGEYVDPTHERCSARHRAIGYGRAQVLEVLLAWRGPNGEHVNQNATEESLFLDFGRAATRLGVDAVKLVKLITSDPMFNPGYSDSIVIGWAAHHGYTEALERFLDDPRVDATASDNYAIKQANQNNHIDAVRLLLAWRGPSGERCTLDS